MITIVDFGSQTTHLIGSRLNGLGITTHIANPEQAMEEIAATKPSGIIFSGGPAGVYEDNAPTIDKAIFDLGIPILGICYGWQLTAHLLGGKVESVQKEYGPTQLYIDDTDNELFLGVGSELSVIQSHGDSVLEMPSGFMVSAHTDNIPYAAVINPDKKIYGVQFHPEVSHTQQGTMMLRNFATLICGEELSPEEISVEEMVAEIREKIGDKKVIGAISGGTDSTVAGTLVAKAIGQNFIPVYIESGLMRAGTRERVEKELAQLWGVMPVIIQAKEIFLERLKGVTDPEQKRKIIGGLYVELFDQETASHTDVEFLLQGTTYADVVESRSGKHTALIKSHHNVGGLPDDMKLALLEPIRHLYTSQVRALGEKLGIPKSLVYQQPFPGPGHAVRILGEVTAEKLEKQVKADEIVVEVLGQRGWFDKIFQSYSILTNSQSTAVKGDGRVFEDVVALRVVDSVDRMTATWSQLPYEVLAEISTRIVNEVPGVSRVVYDITSKPPATMEWE
ncbi:MAG: glutamine-hydrolyzing GMP synthase [Pseudomonadales bacterium]|jgi:GMP synthase (glutamine-hydrolysing)|nr:glutamine-hydrolyzing GMP synthase [Pseudomonadales bacterium]